MPQSTRVNQDPQTLTEPQTIRWGSKVFVVGLPKRSDKRNAMALTSSSTGFHADWGDGVNGEQISDKAVPFGIDRERLWNTNLGRTPLPSHYSWGWDLLWLGHFGEVFPELLDEDKGKVTDDAGTRYMSRKFTISDYPTVPDLDRVTGFIDSKIELPHTRWVHITCAPICTFAYALSNPGAREVLFDLSVDHLTGPFDNALAGLCKRATSSYGTLGPDEAGDRGLDTKCISVTPPIFFHHKAKGPVNTDSYIQIVAGGEIWEHGTTENIIWSARGNLRNIVAGTEMESQYD
ncbi:hypothetical protein DL767_004516 [Monosporascus sp. MG133]|nr:hypothetical protein DL767_004516 [Monosporascus sp. MG133]